MWKNFVVQGRSQMTIWRMRIACWIFEAANAHSEYVIVIAFLLYQWLRERVSVLRYTYVAVFSILEAFHLSPQLLDASQIRRVKQLVASSWTAVSVCTWHDWGGFTEIV